MTPRRADGRAGGGRAGAPARPHLAFALAAVLLAGCAAAGPDDANDPLEGYNRVMFGINGMVDGVLLKPAAELYVRALPAPLRRGVSNLLDNLGEPLNAANNLLQGKPARAGTSLGRFALNTTLGLGGVFDVAEGWGWVRAPEEGWGWERAPEDFGQTLAAWGMGEGPYLVLPLLGPSNPRDALGFAVDWAADPPGRVLGDTFGLGRTAVGGVARRAGYLDTLEVLEETSVDFYAAMRGFYRQHRANAIRDGAPAPIAIPDMDMDEWEGWE